MAIQTSNAASPASPQPPDMQTNHTQTLPLDVIVEVIAYLDDAADLSRLCRTSKVLNDMALPQLYKEITLTRSFPSNEKLTSSFLTALNKLASGNVGPLVKNLVLQDDYNLVEAQSRIWRLSNPKSHTWLDYLDSLKLPAGAAVERCTNLQSYTWNLATVIKPIVYRALGQLQNLQSLHICYWGLDAKQDHFEVPPLPRLRELTVVNYEPRMCRHDFSAVLLHATGLEVLTWCFETQRIREAYVAKLFDQLRKAGRKLRLKSFSLENGGFEWDRKALREAIDVQSLTELSLVKSGSLSRWNQHSPDRELPGGWPMLTGQKLCLKSIQYDGLDQGYVDLLGSFIGLERMYLLEDLSCEYHYKMLRDVFLDAIVTNHGATLRHLMLPAYWPLPKSWIAKLFRTCPNITQLSLAMECEILEGISVLVPFLRKLWAIRVRTPQNAEGGDPERACEVIFGEDEEHGENFMAEHFDFPELRYLGLRRMVWELGRIYEKDGMRRRRMKKIPEEDVDDVLRHVEIWKMATEKSLAV